MKSIGEFLERLALYNPVKKKFIKNKYLEDSDIDLSIFLHYSNEQMVLQKDLYNKLKTSTYFWSKAKDYLNKREILIPAQLVYLSKIFKDETQIIPEQITTGAAFGNNFKQVFENGLLEAVERDAFMISYLTKRKINRITDFPKKISDLLNYLNRYYLDIFIFDITTDLNIPTFMSITIDKSSIGPAVSIGTKSGFKIENVIYGAILESVQARRQTRLSKYMSGDKFKFPKDKEIDSMLKRCFYWYPTKMIKYLDFWLKSNKVITFNKIPEYISSLDNGIKQLKDKNYHIFYVDISLNEIKKAGFTAGKVIIPELQPLYLAEESKMLYSVHGGNIKPDRDLKPQPFC